MKSSEAVEIAIPNQTEYGRVGELIFLVDPYIYPAFFGTSDVARKIMPQLITIANGPFSRERIRVARIEGEVVGVMVLYEDQSIQPLDLSRFCDSSPSLPASCMDVCRRYFTPMCFDINSDEVYISCIATDPANRGKGIASSLIRFAKEEARGRKLVLDVLEENTNAVRLYEKLGFRRVGNTTGYSYQSVAPSVIRMEMT